MIAMRMSKIEHLERYFNEVQMKTLAFDLQSYDFDKDPDCVIVTRV